MGTCLASPERAVLCVFFFFFFISIMLYHCLIEYKPEEFDLIFEGKQFEASFPRSSATSYSVSQNF